MLQIFRSATIFLLLAALPFPAKAELRAVLIGVSDYLTLDADLKGPANDVRLMAEVLVTRGVAASEITVLTSDTTGLPAGVTTAAPTKAEIIAALTQTATRAQPDDTVVFYFSGHGAQAPDQNGDEGGGYDEVFLPADAAGWKGQTAAVENALTDDELHAWAQPMLSRGVKLIGLIDACHSATGFRALPGQSAVARGLAPQDLNIPDSLTPSTVAPSTVAPDTPALHGDFVFLYSSQSDQRSFEYPVGSTGLWQGAFTRQLAEVLRTSPTAPWGQILAATTATMQQGTTPQMPDGEGPMLDTDLFGTPAPRRFLVQDGVLQAGLLQGVNPGDRFSLYASAEGGTPLAQVTLAKVDARRSPLPVDTAKTAWAELDQPAPPAAVELAAPLIASPGDGYDYAAWQAALAGLGTGAAPSDLTPILTDGTVALAGPDGTIDPQGPHSTPRVALHSGETPMLALQRSLSDAAHSLRLRRLFTTVAARSLTTQPPLTLDWQRKPAPECGQPSPAQPVDPAQAVQPCDQLWLSFRNTSGRDLDISILYFNADFSITPLWPQRGLSNRLAAGENGRAGFQINPDSPPADEDILILAVPVDPGSARVDLTLLADPAATRGAGDWFSNRLDADTATRSFSTKPPPLLMIRQTVRVRPTPKGDH